MSTRRIERINSLLREVISEVIRGDVKNPHLKAIWTITAVETTKDLRHAKVFVSVMGTESEKEETLRALESARGFIAVAASKKIVIRFFPELHFILDDGASHQARIEEILSNIRKQEEPKEGEPGEGELGQGESEQDEPEQEEADGEAVDGGHPSH